MRCSSANEFADDYIAGDGGGEEVGCRATISTNVLVAMSDVTRQRPKGPGKPRVWPSNRSNWSRPQARRSVLLFRVLLSCHGRQRAVSRSQVVPPTFPGLVSTAARISFTLLVNRPTRVRGLLHLALHTIQPTCTRHFKRPHPELCR